MISAKRRSLDGERKRMEKTKLSRSFIYPVKERVGKMSYQRECTYLIFMYQQRTKSLIMAIRNTIARIVHLKPI